MDNSPLPPSHPDAVTHSQRLVDLIKQDINNQVNRRIPFVEFMNKALYAPNLGYYSSSIRKFGAEGDFITAPEISPLFSQCLAKQCQQILASFDEGVILEFGAGSGIMAADILKALESMNELPRQYLILELSADLQLRQRETLQAQVPHLLNRVKWLKSLPTEPLQGIILANEVLDAMPVQRFRLDEQGVSEFYVGLGDDDDTPFRWETASSSDELLLTTVEALRSGLDVGYVSELNLALPAWIQSLSDILADGLVLLIDYGFPSSEYYHPQRNQGTLMCHYQHYAHDNPLILVGLQDITAHVNFTAVAEAADAAGLHVSGYTNQGNFLLSCGLTELLSAFDFNDSKNYLQQTQAVKKLMLPHEMGELFKVMALSRNLDMPLLGFAQDERAML
jgi:SAM-dependent MidA family methyltransferase